MRQEISRRKLLAVLTLNDKENAVKIAKALFEGGVSMIELTLRTQNALDCIKAIAKEVPDMLVGAGTILKPEQAEQAKQAGASFGVSPGTNVKVIKKALQDGLFFAPGVMTPSDVETCLEFNLTLLKLFPAGAIGGLNYLKNMSAPYNHLGVQYIPLGGINQSNLKENLDSPLIAAVGGSWLASPDLIEKMDLEQIYKNAKLASECIF